MAYTGTGSQEDPYCVDTFDDFLTCSGTDGAYVKVIGDIDASKEEKYQSAATMLSIRAAEVYADALKKISNFTVLDSNAFYRSSHPANPVIRNIDFRNITFKVNGSGGSIFYSNDPSGYLDFYDCKFSIQAVCGNAFVSVGDRVRFHRCAGSIEYLHEGYTSGYTFSLFGDVFHASDSIFEIISCPVKNLSNSVFFTGVFDYCTLKISACAPQKISDSAISIFGNDSHDNVLILCVNHDNGEEAKETFNVKGTITAVDTEASSGASFTSSGTLYQLTTAQIKSEVHLREIGFIS